MTHAGQMGNSEVGHTNIGGGRVVFQDLPRISRAIEDGTFFENPAYKSAMDECVRTGARVGVAHGRHDELVRHARLVALLHGVDGIAILHALAADDGVIAGLDKRRDSVELLRRSGDFKIGECLPIALFAFLTALRIGERKDLKAAAALADL